MARDKIALATPISVGTHPTINFAYGPWDSIEQARTEFDETFKIFNVDELKFEVIIPVGTTIAIYNEDKSSVTEYWYINGEFIQKNVSSEQSINEIHQVLYTYRTVRVQDDDVWNGHLGELNTIKDVKLNIHNTIVGSTTITWYSHKQSLDEQKRYEYSTQRTIKIGASPSVSNWTTPILERNFAVDGKDGAYKEFIYKIGNAESIKENWAGFKEAYPGSVNFPNSYGWTDDPTGITQEQPQEWCSTRSITPEGYGSITYGDFCEPFIWASFGEEGPDGPGVEYIYYLTPNSTRPEIYTNNKDEQGLSEEDDEYLPRIGNSLNDPCWSDDPLETTYDTPYLWMSSRKSKDGVWQEFSTPVIWNQFGITYKLKLSNDNCTIPCKNSNSYTEEAIKAATLSSISLKQGINEVSLDGLTFKVSLGSVELAENEQYIIDRDNKTFQLIATNLDFTDSLVVISVGTGTDDSFIEYDKCVQTVRLNTSGISYDFKCVPNSRIWYGGQNYSHNEFNAYLYEINSDGMRTQIDDFTKYSLYYQFTNETNPETINLGNDGYFSINDGNANSIYLTLKEGDNIVDCTVIDGIDYSTIKGADNNGVTFEYEENINIPKGALLEYIKNRTLLKLTAWQGTTSIAYTIGSYSANYVENGNIVAVDSENYCLNEQINSNVCITIVVNIPDSTGQDQVHYVTQNVNIDSSSISYDLTATPNYVTFDSTGTINTEGILLSAISSDGQTPSNYEIWFRLDNGLSNLLGDTEFNPEAQGIEITEDLDKIHYLTFILKVDDQERDYETVALKPDISFIPSSLHVELSNPYIQYPLNATFDDTTRQTWTKNTFTVYEGSTKLTADSTQNKYFSITVNNQDPVNIDGVTSYLTQDITESRTIFYTITVYENETELYKVTKAQTIQVVDNTVYQLISNPTSVVANSTGEFKYTPIINKLTDYGIQSVSDLSVENIYYTINNSETQYTKLNQEIKYSDTTEVVTIGLYNKAGQLLDFDSITIVRNGKDGESLPAETFSIRMCGKWDSTKNYCYKSDIDSNGEYVENPEDKFIDVVWIKDTGNSSVFYQALKGEDGDGNKGNNPSSEGSAYWKKAPSYGVLFAEQVLITNGNNLITGGITNTTSDYVLWAGSTGSDDTEESAKTANFSVTREGVLKAKEGLFEGCYMPGTRTLTSPKIKNTLNMLVCDNPVNDSTTGITLTLDLDYSEISESMNFDFQDIQMESTTLATIPVVTNLTKENLTWTYTVEDITIKNIENEINLRLPVGLYVVLNSNSQDPSDSFAYFMKGMHKYRFSYIDENTYIDEKVTLDSDNNVQVSSGQTPLETYLDGLTQIPTDVTSINLCNDTFGQYFNLPFITYINSITNGYTYELNYTEAPLPFFELPSKQGLNTYIDGFLERQLQEALPFLGKTITLTNVPNVVNIVGVLPPELTNLQNLGDCVKHSVKLCRYLTQDDTYTATRISGKKFVQLRCKSYPLVPTGDWIDADGNKVSQDTRDTRGFFIGWELVSCSVESTASTQYEYKGIITQSNPTVTYQKS